MRSSFIICLLKIAEFCGLRVQSTLTPAPLHGESGLALFSEMWKVVVGGYPGSARFSLSTGCDQETESAGDWLTWPRVGGATVFGNTGMRVPNMAPHLLETARSGAHM